LSRNPALLQACGFDPLPRQKRTMPQLRSNSGKVQVLYAEPAPVKHVIPSDWNFSRFLNNVIELEENHQLISGMVNRLREQLMEALPDFGEHLGYDGKAIDSHSTGHSPTFATRPEIQLISPASLIQAIDFVGHGFGKARVVKTCCIEFSVVFVTLPACFYEPQNASRTERNIAIGT
jgi:hypothetical protein